MQTLEELKAENAKLEDAEAEESPQDESVDAEEEAAEVVEEESEDLAESDDEDDTDTEVEGWMQSEDETSQDDSEESDDSAIWATVRKKYKAKSEKEKAAHNEELERLKAEVEALKTQKSTVEAPSSKPKRDDFLDADDPDEAYVDAMFDWRNGQQDVKRQNAEQQANQQKAQDDINSSVDQHYDRAAKLAKANKIEPAVYQQADAVVRGLLGEDITNAIISKMGEGSEKVMFNLGRNPRKLAELQGALTQDQTGLKAMMMLGKMSAELTLQKRKTNAPAPAKSVKGGSKVSNSEKKLKEAYDKAHNSHNTGEAFKVKQAAKAAGHNTRNW